MIIFDGICKKMTIKIHTIKVKGIWFDDFRL